MAITYKTSDGKEFTKLEDAQKHDNTLGFDENHKKIYDTINNYLGSIDLMNQSIKKMQRECRHPKVMAEAKSSTGHYCPEDNHYWFNIECKCCRKEWQEDQDNSKYKNNPNVEWIKK